MAENTRKPTAVQMRLDLLIRDQVMAPAARSIAVLDEAKATVDHAARPVALAGLYVMAVAQVEVAVSDTTRYILGRNPWEGNLGPITLERDDILECQFSRDLLVRHALGKVKDWSYGRKDALFRRFLGISGIVDPDLEAIARGLADVQRRRNGIVHGDSSGSVRAHGGRWPSRQELHDCIDLCLRFLRRLRDSLDARYKEHTHVAALRRLWAHIFDSPIMRFDDYWVVDTSRDRVIAMKENADQVQMLASSERVLLGLWRAEFCSDAALLSEFSVKSLDAKRRNDLVSLVAALRDIWLY